MSETFLRKSTKHLSSFTSRFRKVTQWSFWDCVSSYVPINIHDTLHTLVTWYLRVSWLAQNTAYFQLSNCHWHGKHNWHLSPLIIYFNPLWLNPLSFQVNKADIPENCNISSEEWIFNLTVLFFSLLFTCTVDQCTLSNWKINTNLVIFLSFLCQQISLCACLNTLGLLQPYTEEGTPMQALPLSLSICHP